MKKTKQAVMIQAAKDLHKAVLNEIELMMGEDSDPDALVDAVVRFESIYFPITPKDRNLVRKLMRDMA